MAGGNLRPISESLRDFASDRFEPISPFCLHAAIDRSCPIARMPIRYFSATIPAVRRVRLRAPCVRRHQSV